MNRINLICLGVRDMARSLKFYKDIGFNTPESSDCPQVVFFNNEGTRLELYPLAKLAEDIDEQHPPALPTGGFCGITLAINLKSRQEVDAFFERVAACGGEVVKQPQAVFWGGYSGYFRDPDGYYWEVAHADSWQFDENNMLIIK